MTRFSEYICCIALIHQRYKGGLNEYFLIELFLGKTPTFPRRHGSFFYRTFCVLTAWIHVCIRPAQSPILIASVNNTSKKASSSEHFPEHMCFFLPQLTVPRHKLSKQISDMIHSFTCKQR